MTNPSSLSLHWRCICLLLLHLSFYAVPCLGFGMDATLLPALHHHADDRRVSHVLFAGATNSQHEEEARKDVTTSRRSLLKSSSFLAATTLISWPLSSATAAPQTSAKNEDGLVSTSTVADRLRIVPTFTIVDSKGVPFMVVGEDAKVTGYFFTTYGEANRLLVLAKTSADDNIRQATSELRAQQKSKGLAPLSKQQEIEQVGSNPWKSARISTVPLDTAVTLVTKSMYSRKAGGGNYFQVAPAESDVQDALALGKNGKDELAEGRVPLFYFADFEINDGGIKQSPLYFQKSQLLADWKKRNPSADAIPEVLVTEMFSVLTEMVKPGGKDEDLQSLVFVPPRESAQKAKDCLRTGGKESQFLIGKRIVVL